MSSQNREDEIILNYFGEFKGTLLDVGSNDGRTFSNSFVAIQKGWKGYLLEPSPTAFSLLETLHKGNKNVECFNFGIGEKTEIVDFYESGEHLPGSGDVALLSGVEIQPLWRHLNYKTTKASMLTFDDCCEAVKCLKFDFISIDCEGMDKIVLQQINLKETECKCLCIEFNGDIELDHFFTGYCKGFGMKEIYRSGENLIFVI